MSDPTLVSSNALNGIRVALSVSDSADLEKLGLTEAHLDLVVAEVARAVLLAGGIVVYGGRLRPAGFTQVIMDEVRRYSDGRHAFELYVPEPEHRELLVEQRRVIDSRMGTSGKVTFLTRYGGAWSISEVGASDPTDLEFSDAEALSAMRRKISQVADARIVVGGKLSHYAGMEPGVIEEARLTLQSSKLIYVSGGFGGAAAAIAQILRFDDFEWAPHQFPQDRDSPAVSDALIRLVDAYRGTDSLDGLTPSERRTLAVSHRPGDIASLAVRGIARAVQA